MGLERMREGLAQRAEQGFRFGGLFAELFAQLRAGRGEGLLEGRSLDSNEIVQALGMVRKPGGEFVGAQADRFAEPGAGLAERLGQEVRTHLGLVEERGGEAAQIALEFFGALFDDARGLLARLVEPLQQILRALFELAQQGVAGTGEGLLDDAALVLDRPGDAVARLLQQIRELFRSDFKLARDGHMGAGEGGRNLVGVGDNGFALARKLVEQHADTALVVAIGALERGDLGADHGFEFAGAGQRPLDAVAHRGDLAANRLAQRHHLLGGDGFRLGEANRDLRHRSGGMAHLLCATHHRAHGKEEDDGADEGECGKRRRRAEQRAGESRAMAEDEIADPQPDPGRGGDDRRREGAGLRAGLQALQDLADRGTVVIGRAGT